MEYTSHAFVFDLQMGKPLSHFESQPLPTGIRLQDVVRFSNNIDIVAYYIDKLPHDAAVSTAVLFNLEAANLLLSKNVRYDPSELRFYTPRSIEWARRHEISITIEQCHLYKFQVPVAKAILSCYPHLLQDIDLCSCGHKVLEYIIANHDVIVTPQLLKRIIDCGSTDCFKLVISKINLRDHIKEIAVAWFDMVDYVLHNSDLTIADFGMTLFTGFDAKKKIKAYAPQVQDFVTKAHECNLLQMVIDSDNTHGALYLVQEYQMCLGGSSQLDSAKIIMRRELALLLRDRFIGEEKCKLCIGDVNVAESVAEVANIIKHMRLHM